MSQRLKKLGFLEKRIRQLRQRENAEKNPFIKAWLFSYRWGLLIGHEFVRNDIPIRAESLAYLMMFSVLPLVAGGFFLFTFFAQFGMVQEAIQGTIQSFLAQIPAEHRTFVYDYVIHFKDAYLATISKQSGTIGVFALLVLISVGLKTFNNIDRTLNYIWSSNHQRPFIEQFRNFIVVSFVAPLTIIGGLSVPLILRKIYVTRHVLTQVPLLFSFLNTLIPLLLIFLTFVCVYRYVPVRRVLWRSAALGAMTACLLLQLTNFVIQLYFRFGTTTAYGKAAVVPILVFWMYLVWIVVLVGAEISFLVQNQKEVLETATWHPPLETGRALLVILYELYLQHKRGAEPLTFEALHDRCGVRANDLQNCLRFLEKKNFVFCSTSQDGEQTVRYSLGRDLSEVSLTPVLQDFFQLNFEGSPAAVQKVWNQATKSWLKTFEKPFTDLFGSSK